MSSKFILFDHVHNSHDHPVLQSIDITRRTLTLITLWAPHLFGALALFSRALTFIIVPLFLPGNGSTEQLKITPQRKTNSYPLLDVMLPLGEICTLTFTSSLGVIIFDSRALQQYGSGVQILSTSPSRMVKVSLTLPVRRRSFHN